MARRLSYAADLPRVTPFKPLWRSSRNYLPDKSRDIALHDAWNLVDHAEAKEQPAPRAEGRKATDVLISFALAGRIS